MPDKPNFLNEKAEYDGKKVDLNNPFRAPKGSPKKFYVYVRNEKGNVIKLGFGDPNMEIKRDDPERIKNFRARHNCSDPGPKYKARYWSCKFWEKGKKVSDLTKQGKVESTECDCGCDCCNEQLVEYRGNPYTTERGGKRGPRMSRQRKNRAAVLDHLVLNGIQVLNQPSDVTQKGSSDTFVVAKKDLKRAIEVVDDYFSKPYVRIHMGKNQLRRDNYKIIAESVELNESFFDFYMGMLVAGGGEMTAQQAIGAMLTISSIPIALYGMMGFRHVQRKLNIGGKRLSAARKKLDDIIQDDVRVAVFVDWLQEQPYFDKAIDKLEDANADLKQAYDEKDGAAEEIAQKDIQRILSEFGRALKPDWDKFAAKEGFAKLTDKADIGSGISRNLLNRVNKAGRKYNITNYRVYEDVNEVYKDSGLGDWFGKGGGGGKEEGGWDRYNTSGERIGKCGDAKKGAAYSACLSAEKAKQLGKAKIADFVKRKRDAQKKAGDKAKGGESKKGQKPVMVKTGAKGLDKKNESFMSFKSFISEENVPNNPALWKKAIAKAKSKFDVYPSAYANAWASKWYKSKGGTWSKK